MHTVPEIDRLLGMDVYATQTSGIPGRIRGTTEDFQVEELLIDGSKAPINFSDTETPSALGATLKQQHPYLLCVLTKQNWDTLIATKNVANQLGIGQNNLQIAGIKDAKAITAQYLTLENLTIEDICKVNINGLQIRPIGYLRNPLSLFYLLGNHFKINITNITQQNPDTLNTQINQTIDEITKLGGLPNYYGHQRFGTTRPITHYVGKAIFEGNFEEAALLFLSKPSPHEHPETCKARIELQQTRDFKAALEYYPKQLRYERLMLKYLTEKPNEYLKAFSVLPLKLQVLFVQAYQSYLFNRFLSERIKANLSINQAEVGDFVVGVERTGLPLVNMSQTVTVQNQTKLNEAILAGKMRLALPIVGFKQKLSSGLMGELEQRVLQQENVNLKHFHVTANPRIGNRGSLRTALTPLKDFKHLNTVQTIDGLITVTITFTLLRGCYATILLREVIKPQNLLTAGF
jgi:tRNA pseudouridine13 synthase